MKDTTIFSHLVTRHKGALIVADEGVTVIEQLPDIATPFQAMKFMDALITRLLPVDNNYLAMSIKKSYIYDKTPAVRCIREILEVMEDNPSSVQELLGSELTLEILNFGK